MSTQMRFFNYKWHKDLQQFSIDIWLYISFDIYLPYCQMQQPLLLQYAHSEFPTFKKTTWSDMTQNRYIYYTYNSTYNYTIILSIHVSDIIDTNTNYLLTWNATFSCIWHCYLTCVHVYHNENSVKLKGFW